MTTGQVIAKKRIELGWTQEELAKQIGYTSKSTITKIESDIIDLPKKKIRKFAEVLGLDINDLFPEVPMYDPATGVLTIPFINQKLSAGTGWNYLSDTDLEIRKIDIFGRMARGIDKTTLVAAEVVGDSMVEAGINSGDIVIFSKGLIRQEGIYVINYAGDVMVKKLSFDALANTIDIISANPNYPARTVEAESVEILGKVVGLIHNMNF